MVIHPGMFPTFLKFRLIGFTLLWKADMRTILAALVAIPAALLALLIMLIYFAWCGGLLYLLYLAIQFMIKHT